MTAGHSISPDDSGAAMAAELSDLWQAFLGMVPEGRDTFHQSGGHSLLAVPLARAAQERGYDLQVRDLSADATFSEILSLVMGRAAYAAPPRPPAGHEFPLTTLQRAMVYEALAHNGSRYHVVSSVRMRGLASLSATALEHAAECLAAEHAVLRAAYDLTRVTGPVHVLPPALRVSTRYFDLRGLTAEESAHRVAAERAAEESRPLSLTTPPLWRLTACHTGDAEAEIMFSHWHTLLDGRSVSLLLSALGITLGVPGAPPRWGPAFQEYVEIEQSAARDQSSGRFWGTVLAAHHAPALPPGTPGEPPARSVRDTVGIGHLTQEIQRLSREHRVPLRTVFFAVHLAVLWSMGSPGAYAVVVTDGRLERARANRSIGLFLNPVPFALPRRPASWDDMFTLTYMTERAIWPHRRYPWAVMRSPGIPGPPDMRTCFTYAELTVTGAADDLTESVCTGIPLLVDAAPSFFSAEVIPSMTSLDPGDVATRHLEMLQAAVRDRFSVAGKEM